MMNNATLITRLETINVSAQNTALKVLIDELRTEERSAKMARRLEELEHTTAEHLAPLGLEFFCCSHFYGIARKGEKNQIYIRY